jgi:hypothetical protein
MLKKFVSENLKITTDLTVILSNDGAQINSRTFPRCVSQFGFEVFRPLENPKPVTNYEVKHFVMGSQV